MNCSCTKEPVIEEKCDNFLTTKFSVPMVTVIGFVDRFLASSLDLTTKTNKRTITTITIIIITNGCMRKI